MKRHLLILAFLAPCLALAAPDALAQGRVLPYQPPPTFSPYMNLYRRDSGPLPNYHQFVRPEQELRNTLIDQDTTLQRQANDLGAMRQEQDRMKAERATGVHPTGIGSGFMNLSHYYPTRRGGMQRGIPQR